MASRVKQTRLVECAPVPSVDSGEEEVKSEGGAHGAEEGPPSQRLIPERRTFLQRK